MSIVNDVWNILKSDPTIQKNLDRGLINIRGLSRYLIEKHKIDASMDAVISAIRRFDSKKYEKEEQTILNLLKNSKISTKNNIVCFTLGIDALSILGNILNRNIRAVIGTNEIKIVCEKESSEDIESFLSEYIKKEEKDLSELSITVNQKAVKQKGLVARISNEIAIHNINIVELLISPPEFLIYVKEKDMIKTHETLLSLT